MLWLFAKSTIQLVVRIIQCQDKQKSGFGRPVKSFIIPSVEVVVPSERNLWPRVRFSTTPEITRLRDFHEP